MNCVVITAVTQTDREWPHPYPIHLFIIQKYISSEHCNIIAE